MLSPSVDAQSHVPAVVKIVAKSLTLGKAPGNPWIRVRPAAGGKTSVFHVLEQAEKVSASRGMLAVYCAIIETSVRRWQREPHNRRSA